MSGRLLVMSDIHGMYDELRLLLRSAAYDPGIDRLVVLGDYLDRGKHSAPVVRFFMDLKAQHGQNVTLLSGNHEDMCINAQKGDEIEQATSKLAWLSNEGNTTLLSFGDTVPDEVIAFFEEMPVYAETDSYIFVHAGVHPLLPLSEMNPEDVLWNSSCLPHYSGKMVIVGHVIRDEVTYLARANTLYIDTGAFKGVWGGSGKLSMVDLTNGKVHWVNTGRRKGGIYEEKEIEFDSKS